MRVNARFESLAERQIEYIAKHMGMGVSEVLRLGVDRLYQSIRGEQQHGLRHLGAWIGKGDSGRSDIASNVKAHLQDAFEEKYKLAAVKRERPVAKVPAGRAGQRVGARASVSKVSNRRAA
jgi:hypothetical protein